MGNSEELMPLKYTHPGKLLKEDLDELGLSTYRVSKETGISQVNLSKILKGERSFTPATGLRLAKFLGVSENYFINMQMRYSVERTKETNQAVYDSISTYSATKAEIA